MEIKFTVWCSRQSCSLCPINPECVHFTIRKNFIPIFKDIKNRLEKREGVPEINILSLIESHASAREEMVAAVLSKDESEPEIKLLKAIELFASKGFTMVIEIEKP